MAKRKSKAKEKLKIDAGREQKDLKYRYLNSKVVEYSQVTSVYLAEFGETVTMSGGWEELAMLLLLMVHDTFPEKFLAKLVDGGVINENINVTAGEIKELENGEYKTLSIPKTRFKIKYKLGGGLLYKVIVGCGEILGYEGEDFTLCTLPYRGEIPIKEVRILTVTETLGYYRTRLIESAEIFNVQFRGENKKVKSFHEMSMWVMGRVYGEVQEEDIKKFELANTRGLGVTQNPELEVIQIEEFGDTGWYVYYNNNKQNVMEYFGKLFEHLGLEETLLRFTIKQMY